MPLMPKVFCGGIPSFHCSVCHFSSECMHLQGYGYQQGPPQGAYPQQVLPRVLNMFGIDVHSC